MSTGGWSWGCGLTALSLSMVTVEEEEDEEVSQLLSDDYARAEFIRDRLVPKAVLFFTGEIMDFEDDDVRPVHNLSASSLSFVPTACPSPPLCPSPPPLILPFHTLSPSLLTSSPIYFPCSFPSPPCSPQYDMEEGEEEEDEEEENGEGDQVRHLSVVVWCHYYVMCRRPSQNASNSDSASIV